MGKLIVSTFGMGVYDSMMYTQTKNSSQVSLIEIVNGELHCFVVFVFCPEDPNIFCEEFKNKEAPHTNERLT